MPDYLDTSALIKLVRSEPESAVLRQVSADSSSKRYPISADSPQAISELFVAAINAGDVEGALTLWAEDATLIAIDGSTVAGREMIAGVLTELVRRGVSVEIDLDRVYQAGGTAIATGRLTVRGSDGDGRSFEQTSESLVVYDRDLAGRWRVAIDAPWGLPENGS